MQTTETMTTAPASVGESAYDLSGFTREQVVEHLRTGLAAELPHLSCTVEDRDGTIYVTGVRA